MAGTAHSGGNRAKTRQQHELAGTFRKDRHSDLQSPTPPATRPDPPGPLDEVEQAEWDRMMRRLELSSSLFVVDDAAVYEYCRLYAETERVAVEQADNQAAVKILEANIRGVEKADLVQLFSEIVTLRKLISKATDQLRQGRMAIRQYLVEFGLTPASRSRVKLPAARETVDDFTAFQQRRIS